MDLSSAHAIELLTTSSKEPVLFQPQSESSNCVRPQFGHLDAVSAAQVGVVDRLEELLAKEELDVNQGDAENVTLLHWAAINNRDTVVNFLLKHGTSNAIPPLNVEVVACS